jgi:serine/threonine-protein kinase RsbW
MVRDENRLILPNRPDSLAPLLAFAREKALQVGFDAQGVKEVELALEEMVSNVVEHAYDPGEEAAYVVGLDRKPGRFVLSVEDSGQPLDLQAIQAGLRGSLGLLLVGAFADGIRFTSPGPRGKRIEVVKDLPYADVRRWLTDEDRKAAAAGFKVAGEPVQVRPFSPQDGPAVARCAYRGLGFSDDREFLYLPERLREMDAFGLVEGRVGLIGGEVAGAVLAVREDLASRVGVAGPCAADPRFDRKDLDGPLFRSLVEGLQGAGWYGLALKLAPAPDAAGALADLGACETGFLFGEGLSYGAARVEGAEQGPRRTALLAYVKLAEEPHREVYPPLHHAGMIRRIYDRLGLKREVREVRSRHVLEDLPPCARLDVEVRPRFREARLCVARFGKDLLDHLFARLQVLKANGVEAVCLDLPLSDPAASYFAAPAETLGFSFAGIIPEVFDGDVLRLQLFGGAARARGEAAVAGFAQELLDYARGGMEPETPEPRG